MADVVLKVTLPSNRDRSGQLAVQVNGKTLRNYEVLGRGSKGPGNTWKMKDGNTPLGNYEGLQFEKKDNGPSYGPMALRLKAMSGDALVAHDVHGRDGLLIHGGSLGATGYFRGEGELRATHGCLRMKNDDILALQQLVYSSALNANTGVCELTKIQVEVKAEGFDYEHGMCTVSEPNTPAPSQ